MQFATFANWNIEWAPLRSKRAEIIRASLKSADPDVLCLTETYCDFFDHRHVIEAAGDYGYKRTASRRKVTLSSRAPWSDVSRGEGFAFPPGRLVAGVTETAIGPLRIVGVCVPWREAHVRTGRCDRRPWDEHLAFLASLRNFLASSNERTVVIGDFNQRVPRSRQPENVYSALKDCLQPDLAILTEGLRDVPGSQAIDHLAATFDMGLGPIELLPKVADEGIRLSDHFGFVAHLKML